MFGVGAAAEGSLCRYPAISADLMLPPSLPSRCAARLSVPYWSQCPSRPYTLPRQCRTSGGPTGDGLPRTSPTPFLTDSQMICTKSSANARGPTGSIHNSSEAASGLSSVAIQGPIQPTPDPRGAVPDRPVCSSRAWAMIRVRACWMAAVAPKAMRCPASWSRSQARCPTHRATALLRQRQGGRHQPGVARTATGPRLGDGALGWQGHTV